MADIECFVGHCDHPLLPSLSRSCDGGSSFSGWERFGITAADAHLSVQPTWIALYFAVLVFLFGLPSDLRLRQDPFTMFRRDGLFLTSNKFQRYTNAGLTRTAGRVEALVVGNSYIANVDPTLVEKLFGLKRRSTRNGVWPKEQDTATEFAMALHPEIKMVFFQVPIWDTCSTQPHPATPLPKALYRGYPWALVSYLCRKRRLHNQYPSWTGRQISKPIQLRSIAGGKLAVT